jgi:hypothetical protein
VVIYIAIGHLPLRLERCSGRRRRIYVLQANFARAITCRSGNTNYICEKWLARITCDHECETEPELTDDRNYDFVSEAKPQLTHVLTKQPFRVQWERREMSFCEWLGIYRGRVQLEVLPSSKHQSTTSNTPHSSSNTNHTCVPLLNSTFKFFALPNVQSQLRFSFSNLCNGPSQESFDCRRRVLCLQTPIQVSSTSSQFPRFDLNRMCPLTSYLDHQSAAMNKNPPIPANMSALRKTILAHHIKIVTTMNSSSTLDEVNPKMATWGGTRS